jgi:hypothetical protein
MEEMGLSINKGGVAIDKDKFYLVNLNEDPSMSDMLMYFLKVSERALAPRRNSLHACSMSPPS